MLKALADEHVHQAIVQALRRRGVDVITVQDCGLRGADDLALLRQALQEERAMLTNDHHFLGLAAQCAARGETFAPIFYWQQQRRSVGEMVRRIIREASRTGYSEALSRVYFL